MPGAAKAAHRGALIVLWADRVVGQGDVVQVPEGSIVQLHVGTRLGVVEVHDHGGGARRQEVRQRSQAPTRRHQDGRAHEGLHLDEHPCVSVSHQDHWVSVAALQSGPSKAE